MTDLKMLEALNKILVLLPEGESKNITANTIKEVERDIYWSEVKKSGQSLAVKAAERIMSTVPPSREEQKGAYIINDMENPAFSYQYITGVYSLVRLTEPLPVTALKEGVEPLFDVEKMLLLFKKKTTRECELPERAALATYIKTDKAKHKGEKKYIATWDFGEDMPLVNAQYLLDMLDLLGECKAWCGGMLDALYFENDKGAAGMLLPVKKPIRTATRGGID